MSGLGMAKRLGGLRWSLVCFRASDAQKSQLTLTKKHIVTPTGEKSKPPWGAGRPPSCSAFGAGDPSEV